MKLLTKLGHLWGKQILCNGTLYKISDDGCADVSAEDAKRLLASSEWVPVKDDKGAAKAAVAPKAAIVPPTPVLPDPPGEPVEAPEPAPVADDPGSDLDSGGSESKPEPEPEWPDPDISMSKSYLQKMAKAYDIKFDNTWTKKQLVDAITVVMYDEDPE